MLFTATFTFFALVAIFPCTFLFRVVLSQKAVFLPRLIFFSFSFLFSLSRWPCFSTSSRRPQLLRVRETAALAAKKQRSRHCSKWPTCRLSARPLAPRPAEASRFSCARGNCHRSWRRRRRRCLLRQSARDGRCQRRGEATTSSATRRCGHDSLLRGRGGEQTRRIRCSRGSIAFSLSFNV